MASDHPRKLADCNGKTTKIQHYLPWKKYAYFTLSVERLCARTHRDEVLLKQHQHDFEGHFSNLAQNIAKYLIRETVS